MNGPKVDQEPASTAGAASDSGSSPCSSHDLQCWFGLDRASFLTLPRVLMEAMPKEWQDQMAALLHEYDAAMVNPPDLGTRVIITKAGRAVETPDWIKNYRRPYSSMVNQIMGRD